MDTGDLLREARQRHGLSIRAAAARCSVPRATWAGWEAGTSAPGADRLEQVLAQLDLDLVLVDRHREPARDAEVQRHLRLSLTERARRALGEQLMPVLGACCSEPRLLTGPAAVGVWVPHIVARGPLPLPTAPRAAGLVPLRLDVEEERRAVRAVVPCPWALVRQGAAEQYPSLLIAARLFREQAARDLAGRRLPPHREPDEEREARDLAQTLTWGGYGRLPIAANDSRAWRLGAPATLDEALALQRLPRRNSDRRPGARRF